LECSKDTIVHYDFVNEDHNVIRPYEPIDSQMTGHSGADWHIFHAFIEAIRTKDPKKIIADPIETLESHLLVFAAEKSRKTGQIIDTSQIRKEILHFKK